MRSDTLRTVKELFFDWAEGREEPEPALRALGRRSDRVLIDGVRDVPVRTLSRARDRVDTACLSAAGARRLARLLTVLPRGRLATRVNTLASSVASVADRSTLGQLLFALHVHGTQRSARQLVEQSLVHRSARVRENAALAAAGLSEMPEAFPRLTLADADARVRGSAALALGGARWDAAVRSSLLRQMLSDSDVEVRGAALVELAEILPVDEVELLVRRHSRRRAVVPEVLRLVRSLLAIRRQERTSPRA